MNAMTVPTSKVGRTTRRPSHTFHLRQLPYQIQPFMIAPVLPGETMKNLLLQSRCVSKPVKNPLIGWWDEYYFFYVKHRDLEVEAFEEMMLDPEYDLSAQYSAASTVHYHFGSTVNWSKLCLDRIVSTYFRDENEASPAEIGGLPIASINQESWLDSVVNEDAFEGPADVNVDTIDGSNADDIMASDVDKAMRMWQFQRAHGLTAMDYEDFLATYGVSVAAVRQNRPELIRYIREWTYPTNTIDPSSGSPSSALSWSVAERADKDRFFREPGFVIGLHVVRPKVYLSNQYGSVAGLLNDAFSWLPAIMRDDPYTSLKKVAALSGPLAENTDAYIVDLKDLFLYGDQFVNFALTETDAGMVALPTAGLQKRYVASTDIDALFVDAASGGNQVRSDGVVTLSILGGLKDTTPPVSRLAV